MVSNDITFCTFYKNCKDKEDCNRALTMARFKEIKRQWGIGDPMLSCFAAEPDCFKE